MENKGRKNKTEIEKKVGSARDRTHARSTEVEEKKESGSSQYRTWVN